MTQPLAYIIEDNVDLSNIFSEALQTAGYETVILSDGNDVVAEMKKRPPFLVLLDLHLPNIAGDDILDEIRATPTLKDVRVVVASADARRADGVRELADLVLNKPISFVQLNLLAKRLHPG